MVERSFFDALPETTRIVADEGYTVLARENQVNPLTAVTVGFRGGVRQETADRAGITCLMQKLVLKSTSRRSSPEVAERFEYLGAGLAPFCYHDLFGFTVNILSRNFWKGLRLLSECVRSCQFELSEVERERKMLLFEMSRRGEDPMVDALDRSDRLLFAGHPYGRPVQGTRPSLEEVSRDALRSWYGSQVRPSDMVVSVVGDLRASAVVDMVREVFHGLAPGGISGCDPSSPEPLKHRRETVPRRGRKQVVTVLAFRAPPFAHPDYVLFQLLNSVLAGAGGRLFSEIRGRRSLAYAVHSAVTRRQDGSVFRVQLATRPDRADEAYQAVMEALGRLGKDLVSDNEVHRAKKYLLGLFELSLQRKSVEAYQLAFHELMGVGFRRFDDYPQQIRDVDAQGLLEVARRYLNPKLCVWVSS